MGTDRSCSGRCSGTHAGRGAGACACAAIPARRRRGRVAAILPAILPAILTAILTAILALGAVPAIGQGTNQPVEAELLAGIRERFYVAVDDREETYVLGAYIESRFATPPERFPAVVLAFYAAVEGLKGRHDANLLKKYQYVKAAIALFQPLVEAHPENLEVRFLRFSFYHQIPGVFGVRSHVPEDLEAALRLLERGGRQAVPEAVPEAPPRSVQRDMVDYILRSGEASREQRRRLESLAALLGEP